MTEIQVDPTQKLDSLAQDAASEDQGKAFMNPKRGRGRPKGSKKDKETVAPEVQTSPPPTPEQNIEALKPILKPCFEMISGVGVRLCEEPQAAMTAAELNILVDTGAACIQQYLPGALTAHANLIVLMMTMGNWGMKVYMIREAKLAQYREEFRQRQEMNGTARPEQNHDTPAFTVGSAQAVQ